MERNDCFALDLECNAMLTENIKAMLSSMIADMCLKQSKDINKIIIEIIKFDAEIAYDIISNQYSQKLYNINSIEPWLSMMMKQTEDATSGTTTTNMELAKTLCFSPEKQGNTLVNEMIKHGDLAACHSMTPFGGHAGSLYSHPSEGNSPLQIAYQRGHSDFVKEMYLPLFRSHCVCSRMEDLSITQVGNYMSWEKRHAEIIQAYPQLHQQAKQIFIEQYSKYAKQIIQLASDDTGNDNAGNGDMINHQYIVDQGISPLCIIPDMIKHLPSHKSFYTTLYVTVINAILPVLRKIRNEQGEKVALKILLCFCGESFYLVDTLFTMLMCDDLRDKNFTEEHIELIGNNAFLGSTVYPCMQKTAGELNIHMLEQSNEKGESRLHIAARLGDLGMARRLLENGADSLFRHGVNALNAVEIALDANQREMAQFLIPYENAALMKKSYDYRLTYTNYLKGKITNRDNEPHSEYQLQRRVIISNKPALKEDILKKFIQAFENVLNKMLLGYFI